MKFIKRMFSRKKKALFFEDVKETPLDSWLRINEGNLVAIIKRKGVFTQEELKKAWFKLNDSYIKTFGYDKKVKRVLELRKRYALAMASYLESGDRRHEMTAKMLEVDINKENEDAENVGSEKSSFTDLIAVVEKYFGFQLDPKETTVEKFYTYLKLMREEREKLDNFKPLTNG